jgi:hypothetical protein
MSLVGQVLRPTRNSFVLEQLTQAYEAELRAAYGALGPPLPGLIEVDVVDRGDDVGPPGREPDSA